MHFTVSSSKGGGGWRRPSIEISLARVEYRGLSTPSAKDADSGRDDGVREEVSVAGGVMPTVISKMGPERVRRRAVPRTSPMREAMSPGL